MPTKHLFILVLTSALLSGCNLMDRQKTPNIAETPPYWQPQSELARQHLADVRAFHERESAQMSEDIRVARNREMDRLQAARKELEKDQLWQEDYEKTLERREKWTNWFKRTGKTEKEENQSESSMATSRIGGTNQNVR